MCGIGDGVPRACLRRHCLLGAEKLEFVWTAQRMRAPCRHHRGRSVYLFAALLWWSSRGIPSLLGLSNQDTCCVCFLRPFPDPFTRSLRSGNRAQANLKLENYGSAMADADEALKLDPRFTKAYYRRGSALVALARYKEARSDFVKVTKLEPNAKDAVVKLAECDKMIRQKVRLWEKALLRAGWQQGDLALAPLSRSEAGEGRRGEPVHLFSRIVGIFIS